MSVIKAIKNSLSKKELSLDCSPFLIGSLPIHVCEGRILYCIMVNTNTKIEFKHSDEQIKRK